MKNKLYLKVAVLFFLVLVMAFGYFYCGSILDTPFEIGLLIILFSFIFILPLTFIQVILGIFLKCNIRKLRPVMATIFYIIYAILAVSNTFGFLLAYQSSIYVFSIITMAQFISFLISYFTKSDIDKSFRNSFIAILLLFIGLSGLHDSIFNFYVGRIFLLGCVPISIIFFLIKYNKLKKINNLIEEDEKNKYATIAFELCSDNVSIFFDVIELLSNKFIKNSNCELNKNN